MSSDVFSLDDMPPTDVLDGTVVTAINTSILRSFKSDDFIDRNLRHAAPQAVPLWRMARINLTPETKIVAVAAAIAAGGAYKASTALWRRWSRHQALTALRAAQLASTTLDQITTGVQRALTAQMKRRTYAIERYLA